MTFRSVLFLILILSVAIVVTAEVLLPSGFADTVAKTGKPYPDGVAVMTNVRECG